MSRNENRVFLGVGSNLGNRASNINKALAFLNDSGRITVIQMSRIFETEPVGNPDQNKFLNAVIEIRTSYLPDELLGYLHQIETKLGRIRTEHRDQPRTIDLDILLYNDIVLNASDLKIPHPRMADRWFVLKPFAEISPDIVHPVLKRTIRQLLADLSVDSKI
jgi:2-amino-4-hydroxy-6-hydroxymethyldihydropteridine diphosphokinase